MLMAKVTVVQLMTCLVMVGSGLGSTSLVVVGRCPGSWYRGSSSNRVNMQDVSTPKVFVSYKTEVWRVGWP